MFLANILSVAFYLSVALAGGAAGAVQSPVRHELPRSFLERRTPERIQYSPGANRTELTPQFFPEHGSRRVKLAYGPLAVPPMSKSNGMVDYLQVEATMPCTDCTITFLQASLEYPNGTIANADTSLWLHHVVLINMDEDDVVCGKNFYAQGQRWFASGNERTPGDISKNGTIPTGYYMPLDAINVLLIELMNQAMYTQEAVPVFTYEYIKGFPKGFYKSKPIWLDLTGCGGSEVAPKTDTVFEDTSPAWTADFSGAVTAIGGHLHDGGVNLEVFHNKQEVCNCVALYGQTPAYWDKPGTSMVMPMSPSFVPMSHISSINPCFAPTSMMVPGDEWSIKAYYNFTEYAPMVNTDGTLADIMGISLVYVADGMSQSAMESYAGTKVTPLATVPQPTGVVSAGMNMGMGMSDDSPMVCVPSRDSPGTITTNGLNMKNINIATGYLTAILNDTCLQVWSNRYAEYFWYGIVVVIALATLARLAQWSKETLRLQQTASNRYHSAASSGVALTAISKVQSAARAVAYIQFTPSSYPSIVKIPPIGTVLLMLAYFGFLLALEFIHVSTGDDQTYQSMGVRAAWLSVAQLPLIILLASKRNFIDLLTAVSYERLNVFHRWTARGLLMTTTMHFGFQSTGWARAGVMQLEWSTDACPPTGIAAYALVLWMNLSTLSVFRRMSYELFVAQHIITFFGLIIAIMIHIPSTALYARTYVYIGIGLYLFSRLVQTLFFLLRNLSPGSATMVPISDCATRIVVKNKKLKSWTPGSFVLLSIPRFGFLQSHPATIMSTPTSHGGDLVFLLKKRSGFTKKIHQKSVADTEYMSFIDGPYGGHQGSFAAYDTVVLIAGSTGISFTLPILVDIVGRVSKVRGQMAIRNLYFVWTLKHRELVDIAMEPLRDALNTLRTMGTNVKIQVHVTGDESSTAVSLSEKSEVAISATPSNDSLRSEHRREKSEGMQIRSDSGSSTDFSSLSASIPTITARPDVGSILSAAKEQCHGEMAVAVCGPLSLSSSVRSHVSHLELKKSSTASSVYLHVEGFSW